MGQGNSFGCKNQFWLYRNLWEYVRVGPSHPGHGSLRTLERKRLKESGRDSQVFKPYWELLTH